MAVELFMPALSPTMEKGTLAKWLKQEGDSVASGDIVAEIETDKATMEYEAVDEGILAKIFVSEGTDDVPVGALIAVIAEEGEKLDEIDISKTITKTVVKPDQSVKDKEQQAPVSVPSSSAPFSSISSPAANGEHRPASVGERIKASPLAKRMALQAGLDLTALTGSGPHGRIVKRDIEAVKGQNLASKSAVSPTSLARPSETVPTYGPHADVPHRVEKLSNMRKTIARRLTESKTTVPHFYLTVDCELDNLLAQRKILNAKLADSGIKLSVNDFIVRATGLALKKVPAANVQYEGDTIVYYERADVSVAVAIDGGLVTPVVKGADQTGLSDISSRMKDLALRAREGTLMPEEYTGGTFSISNLGMFGIKDFQAVINPPQACILAVGSGSERAVVKDGALAVATVMSVTLSCDHRAVDGAVGAEFLSAFKGYIEDPLMMLL